MPLRSPETIIPGKVNMAEWPGIRSDRGNLGLAGVLGVASVKAFFIQDWKLVEAVVVARLQ
jgi:hypothetical protein